MKTSTELIILGTGDAMATKCYNTCFILRTDKSTILVDGGGGNGILRQLENVGVGIRDISSIFLTHSHSDHILGIVWILRMIGENVCQGIMSQNKIKIFSNKDTLRALISICMVTLSNAVIQHLDNCVEYNEIVDGQTVEVAPKIKFQVFDTKTPDIKQMGFKVALPNKQTLVCFGDSPCTDEIASWGEGVDWMLCEAFCLESEKDIFHPHDIHHNTVMETAEMAHKMKVRNLILYHTEDTSLDTRKQAYTAEASKKFNGYIFVPNDLEIITIESNTKYGFPISQL